MRQHVIGHHRRQRDRDREAGEDRNDVGFAQRREQPALDSRQREQRHEHQHDDRRRIDDAGSDLLRGRDDHVECRSGMFQRAIFAQPPEDVLDIDDGVVDQFAERDGETAQRHGVDGQPGKVEDRGRGQDRDRNRGERNHRGSPVQEKGEQHDGDDDAGFHQDLFDVADRRLDEVGLAEDDLVGLDALRKRRRDLLQGPLDLAGQGDRIDVGLLLDRDDDGRLAHVTGFAALHLGRELDGRDLAQKHRPAIHLRHDDAAKVVQTGGSADIPDQVFARMLVGETAAGVDAELGQRLFDLLIGDAEAAQRRRIRRNAILANLAADRDDLGDARDREQARANDEVGGLADFHRGRLLAGHRDAARSAP